MVAFQGGLIKNFKITAAEDGFTVSLSEIARLDMGSEVSAICLADTEDAFTQLDMAYVTLYDAPHYSLNIV